MSAYVETPYRIRAGALDPAFVGDPQEFLTEVVSLLSIVAPTGFYGIVVSDTAPTSNVGLWLRGGTKPYVWDALTSTYIPIDLSDSLVSVLAAIVALQSLTGTHTAQITALQAVDTALTGRIVTLEGYASAGRVLIQFAEPAAGARGNLWVQTNEARTTITALRFWDGTAWATIISFPTITQYVTALADRASIPAAGSKVEFSHGLAGTPYTWTIGIVCTHNSGSAGYDKDDFLPVSSILRSGLSESHLRVTEFANATTLGFVRNNGLATLSVNHKGTGVLTVIDESRWKVMAVASR